MIEKRVFMGGHEVIIRRKNIKNLYLRIDTEGRLIVSCNQRIKDSQIRSFIERKEGWIRKRIGCVQENFGEVNPDGRNIRIFSKDYRVRVIKGSFEEISLDAGKLMIITRDTGRDNILRIINAYLYDIFDEYLGTVFTECRKHAEKYGIRKDVDYRIKFMTSRYGSYSRRTSKISLNLILVKFRDEVIRSVIYHELAHIKHPDHQEGFYRLLYRLCPEYDTLSRELKADRNFTDTWFLGGK